MEMSSVAQQLRTIPASNLTALSHCLKSSLNGFLTIEQLQQLNQSLRNITGEFQVLFGDCNVDILLPQYSTASITIIFYGTHDNDHFYRMNLPNFRQHLLSIKDLWSRAEYFELPVQHLTMSDNLCRHMSSLVLEMELDKPAQDESYQLLFQVAAFTRPYPGLSANGDGYWYIYENNRLFVCVVDGLGHGEDAQVARKKAIESVQQHYNESFDNIFGQAHRALAKTRGVAMTIARICFTNNTMESAGIGNVELKLYPTESFFVPKAGVLGMGKCPKIKVAVSNWVSKSLMVLYSDGLTSKWTLQALEQAQDYSACFLSHLLVRSFERETDDSTALIVLGL